MQKLSLATSDAQYSCLLLGMGPTDSRTAHGLLGDSGIDHTWFPGELGFKDPQARLDAIYYLWRVDPVNFGWRWRAGTPPLTQEKKLEWMATAPVKPEYAVGVQTNGTQSKPGINRRPPGASVSYVSREDRQGSDDVNPMGLQWPREGNRKPAHKSLGGKGARNKKKRGTT